MIILNLVGGKNIFIKINGIFMKKTIIFVMLFLFLANTAISATNNKVQQEQPVLMDEEDVDELKYRLRGDFATFLQELYKERERGQKQADKIAGNLVKVLENANEMIKEAENELKVIGYKENRNLLIASIFLWISITIFIVINLVFANNLKKELYFLRNGLLRSEIKDNMINLAKQLSILNNKIDLLNKKEEQ